MKANKVKKDSTIGIFSSSSPVSATVPVRYNRGKEYLTNKGFSHNRWSSLWETRFLSFRKYSRACQ